MTPAWLAVIDPVDASHQRAARRAADAKKDKALAAAGSRILRWQPRPLPGIATIEAQFIIGGAVDRPAASAPYTPATPRAV